jgi:hypothetical protein
MLDKLKALFAQRAAPLATPPAGSGYTLVEAPAERVSPWDVQFPKYDRIAGYSHLGHFFLRASADNEYIVLHPFKSAAKSYGVFESVAAFQAAILDEPGFADYVLRLPHVAVLRERLGPLGPDEIYIPQPYPFLGGLEEPESYDKGNVWTFIDLVGQMQGHEP